MYLDPATTRSAVKIAAWATTVAAVVCVLLAPTATGQFSTVRFDPDATRERLRALSGDFGERVESRPRPPVAGKRAVPSRLDTGALRTRPGFFQGHLLPRMSRQVADVSSIHSLETQRGWFEGSSMHDWVADTVGYRALRATRKAAKAYLYEATPIGGWLESGPAAGRPPGSQRKARVKVDVSHGIPKVGLRHRAGAGATRLDLGLDGSVRFEFRPSVSPSARLAARYVAADATFLLSYRVGF
jgi:hypothetical protein